MASGRIPKATVGLRVALASLLAVAHVAAAQLSAQSIATYHLTVTNSWSQESHEDWAPLFTSVQRAHFSHLGGGTHDSSLSVWQEGGLSSPGMVYMQETGWVDHPDPTTVDLKSEFDTHIADGSAYSFLNYPRHFSPLEPPVTVSLDVSSTHPLVTLVSMLGPSPDWFIGVSGLNMRESGNWREEITVDLFTYDGGTRSNDETFLCCQNGPLESPQKPISLFTDTPNVDDPLRTALTGDQIGTFTFELQSVHQVGGTLLPGDADQDLDVDQLDLVQVQIAGKYLSGQPATWGEGDWDGAPGGSPGNPPTGDGLFNQFDIVAVQQGAAYLSGPYAAIRSNGQSGDGQTSVAHSSLSDELFANARAGVPWTPVSIGSAAHRISAYTPQNPDGSLVNDAQIGLPDDFALNDFSLNESLTTEAGLGIADVVHVPEPAALRLFIIGLLVVLPRCRHRHI